jgi:hypothetical protein
MNNLAFEILTKTTRGSAYRACIAHLTIE